MGTAAPSSSSWFERNSQCLRAASTALVLTTVAVLLTFRSLHGVHNAIYLWPATGIQLGILLPVWKSCRMRLRAQIAGAFGVFFGCFLSGLPPWFALSIAFISFADVWLVGTILSVSILGFEDLKKRRNLWRFLVGAQAGPAMGALLSSLPVTYFTHLPLLKSAVSALLADSLGLLVILPAVLFIYTGKYRRISVIAPYIRASAGTFLLYTVVLGYIFWQSSYPLLFAIFPPMVVLLVSMGLEGGVYISAVTAAVGLYATSHGHGPIMLIHAGTTDRFIILQMYLAMVTATALPVGALWDERLRAEIVANEAREVYQTLLSHADDMIILSSLNSEQRYVSPACEKITGWTPEEFLLLDRQSTFHPDDYPLAELVVESIRQGKMHHQFRYRIAHKDGSWRWVEASVTAYLNPSSHEVSGYVGTLRDITEHHRIEQQRDALERDRESLEQLAQTDPLTGLPNRRAFDSTLQLEIFSSAATAPQASLMLIDIDNFKRFNDTYGHQAGDRCLIAVADALRGALGREADFVGRWGGEEFVVLLPGTPLRGAQIVAAELLRAVRDLNIPHEHSHRGCVTVSIGIAPLDDDSRADSRAWLQKADRALYESKRMGKDQVRVNLTMYEGSQDTDAIAS
ncbi:PAS domain S-box-containing protein/diguanylate cyclase (GGDEF) domain-containing protein [Bryocella elongata]|uniref:diguanylate cyclase n=1 Tax=Bryocella elongata TaxID=863522 RepID=A0A1H5S5C7_9BACT|nr:diguanylate cyclase [Bryocella elongata]SEF45816.1 PAS domain S-box-containing protein/diguanylate cyclase (GGDEF) domain-containing protein [Bryocella elongata]